MSEPRTNHDGVERLRERFAAVPIYGSLGVRIEHLERGDARVGLRCAPVHANLDGQMHGGIISLLADTAMGLVARLEGDADGANATLQMTVALQSGARVGDEIICQARATHRSRRFVWTACDVLRAGEEAPVAQATGLQMLRPAGDAPDPQKT